jgi:glycerol kinase
VEFILVLDIGTTTAKALAFDASCRQIGRATEPLTKQKPKRGWVEQDPQMFVDVSKRLLGQVLSENGLKAADCRGLGITNQRETTILWDMETSEPIYPAIVWEDHRTKRWCERHQSLTDQIRRQTGLALEPYFSFSKIAWLLAHVPKAKRLFAQDFLRFGTIDTWLAWNLCENHPHVTDVTNASRTLLFDLTKNAWDEELIRVVGLSATALPRVRTSASSFGRLNVKGLEGVPLVALCGDQQASFFAACSSGAKEPCTKVTFGTGTFLAQSIGDRFRTSDPFYTMVAPFCHPRENGDPSEIRMDPDVHRDDNIYAVEAKIERGGKQLEPLLSDPKKTRLFLSRLAKDVAKQLRAFPERPKEIIVDGGVSRDGIVGSFLSKEMGVTVRPLSIFDGTALGAAELAWQSINDGLSRSV